MFVTEYQKAVGVRKQLDAQLNENNMVKEVSYWYKLLLHIFYHV